MPVELLSLELIRLLDVFCGAGGLALGWLQAAAAGEAELVAAVDRDPTLRQVIDYNFPTTRYVEYEIDPGPSEDSVDGLLDKLDLSPGSIDVVIAGTP